MLLVSGAGFALREAGALLSGGSSQAVQEKKDACPKFLRDCFTINLQQHIDIHVPGSCLCRNAIILFVMSTHSGVGGRIPNAGYSREMFYWGMLEVSFRFDWTQKCYM